MIRTRFAPSPTGDLHIGGARTALFNYLFAKHHHEHGSGGEFLLRIEDTDEKRSTDKAISAILSGLNWLKLDYQKPYILQSENKRRHQEIVQKLLEKGLAYNCYTSKEELEELRQESQNNGKVFRFQSPWRSKNPLQKSDVDPVVRIKTPAQGYCLINDLVQGQVKISNSEIDDFVIQRADGTPTYMLAVVVDDFDMKITHVIRGDDHLTNAFKQKIIYESLGWQVPQFAHIPLIYGPDGSKISKRHGATSVIEYQGMGYLPQAMRNYLLRLGWSHGDDEIICDKQAIEWFNIDNVGKSPSRFDFNKLNSLNKFYIKNVESSKLLQLIKLDIENSDFVKNNNKTLSQSEWQRIVKALEFIKEKSSSLNDLVEPCLCYLSGFSKKFDEQQIKQIQEKSPLVIQINELLQNSSDWKIEEIKSQLNKFCQDLNMKIKDFGPIMRLLLTFSNKSPGGIFDIIYILGKDEVLRRTNGVINP